MPFAREQVHTSTKFVNDAFCIGFYITMLRILFTPKKKSKNYNVKIWSDQKYCEFDLVLLYKTEDNKVAGWTSARYRAIFS